MGYNARNGEIRGPRQCSNAPTSRRITPRHCGRRYRMGISNGM